MPTDVNYPQIYLVSFPSYKEFSTYLEPCLKKLTTWASLDWVTITKSETNKILSNLSMLNIINKPI